MLKFYQDEYIKRIKSGLAWDRNSTGQGSLHYHIPFDAKNFLSRFSEDEAREISNGIEPAKYKQEKKFTNLRRLLDGLSEEERKELFHAYQSI